MLVPISAGLVALPVILMNVQQQAFTLFLLSFGAVNFAPSLDLGVARTAQRRVAYAMTSSGEVRSTIIRHSLRQATIVAIAMAILVTISAIILFPHDGDWTQRGGLAAATGIGVGLAIYANCQRNLLEGLGAFSRSALNRAGVGIMLIGAPVLASFVARDATLLILAALVVRVPFMLEQQRAIRLTLSRHASVDNGNRENLIRGFIRESGWFALLAILAVAMSGFDRYIMIGLGGLAGQPLTVFLATQELALRAIAIPTALLPVLIVRLAGNHDSAQSRHLTSRLFVMIVPLVVLGCVGGTFLSEWILRVLYPELLSSESVMTLRILFIGITASVIAQFPMARLVATGKVRDTAVMHLIQFIIYLSAVPSVVGHFGAIGSAALWSSRIVVDAAMLILWSAFSQQEKPPVSREGIALISAVAIITTIGLTA